MLSLGHDVFRTVFIYQSAVSRVSNSRLREPRFESCAAVCQPGESLLTTLLQFTQLYGRDGVSTIQMYSSTSTITLNMHEYEYSENKCTRV